MREKHVFVFLAAAAATAAECSGTLYFLELDVERHRVVAHEHWDTTTRLGNGLCDLEAILQMKRDECDYVVARPTQTIPVMSVVVANHDLVAGR